MVGSGGRERSKEAVGMMALHKALRSVCLNTDWIYSVFWTIRPRPRVRGGNGCKVGDDNGSLMLMWEDGFCRECLDERMNGGEEDPVRKSFSKMSIQLYNYGEGLMGKVASDKCHKWVFKEPEECEPNISNYWQSSFDALPPEWNEQFESGIQTIAVIQAGHGLLQLGSCKIIPEDLHFVLRMRHTFESLGYQSGLYLSQIFSSTRPAMPIRPPPPLFNWASRPVSSSPPMLAPPAFQSPARIQMERPIMADHENDDIKWPNGLSFFSALTGRADEAKLLFNPAEAHSGTQNNNSSNNCSNSSNNNNSGSNPNEFLSLDNCHSNKRSLTLPEQMATSNSVGHRGPNSGEFRNEGGLYSDVMETFLE